MVLIHLLRHELHHNAFAYYKLSLSVLSLLIFEFSQKLAGITSLQISAIAAIMSQKLLVVFCSWTSTWHVRICLPKAVILFVLLLKKMLHILNKKGGVSVLLQVVGLQLVFLGWCRCQEENTTIVFINNNGR